jgi:protein-S-isoprenylcysteine O-methyltransferase Ste14
MKDAPAYRLWPPLSIAIPLLAGWILDKLVRLSIPLPRSVELVLSFALALASALVNGAAYWMMNRARTGVLPGRPAVTILQTGPFARSRNPVYVGLTLAFVAFALWNDSLWSLLLSPAVFAGLHFGAVLPEERYLEAKFGESYLSYKRRVRRWL